MMFQQATLFPWRSTLENVVLPIEIRDGRAAARAEHDEARALLELVGLKGFEAVYSQRIVGRHGAAGRDLPDADHRNRTPLGDEESISRDRERGVMVEASPASAL
jgi:hypothetical protein